MVPNVASSNLVTRPIKFNPTEKVGLNFTRTDDQILEMAVASSTRRREADGSMPVREANEPRERSPNVIWTKQSGHPLSLALWRGKTAP